VSLLAASRDGFAVASLMAVVAMVAGNCVLLACSARWERLARLEGRPNEA
jgi:hypothetical protein